MGVGEGVSVGEGMAVDVGVGVGVGMSIVVNFVIMVVATVAVNGAVVFVGVERLLVWPSQLLLSISFLVKPEFTRKSRSSSSKPIYPNLIRNLYLFYMYFWRIICIFL